MGTLIKSHQLSKEMFEKIVTPIVLCSSTPKLERFIAEGELQEFSFNTVLAESLQKIDPAVRPHVALDEASKIASSLEKPVLLTDYEMLFDPRYKIDVLRFFCKLSGRVKVVIKWCGTFDGKHLIYATPDHRDFHSYDIQHYDITYVM